MKLLSENHRSENHRSENHPSENHRITFPSLRQTTNNLLGGLLLVILLVSYLAVAYLVVVAVGVLLIGRPPILDISLLIFNFFFPPWLTWLTWAGIALTVWPVGRWLHQRISELIYGQYDNPYALLAQLNQHLDGINTPAALLPTVAATLAATLNLPYVAIETTLETAEPVAVYGTPPPHAEIISIPLAYRGTTLGALRVSARSPHWSLSAADTRLLADLARQVGITLRAAHLTEALHYSREQLVLAQEEERRRIRRDLHDGLGPILAALAMQADTAQVLIESDPQAARELMATVTEQAKEVVAEVRQLVYALRPPALDELGLLGALEQLVRQHRTAGLQIELIASAVAPCLAAAVEVAIYRIAAEALTNVVRHAHATHCSIALTLDDAVSLTVEDNGVGMGEQIVPGIGLRSMRERASEVSGEMTIASRTNGGTRIVTSFPQSTARIGQ